MENETLQDVVKALYDMSERSRCCSGESDLRMSAGDNVEPTVMLVPDEFAEVLRSYSEAECRDANEVLREVMLKGISFLDNIGGENE